MTTLLLAPELFTTDSGIPRILRLYLKALCELAGEADQVRFVTMNDVAITADQLRPYTGPALGDWANGGGSKIKFILQALKLSRGTRLIICGHVAQLPVAWFASWFRPGLRTVLVAHGIEVWRPFSFLERRALKRAHRILCVSEFTRRELAKHVSLDARRLVVLPNALDPQLAAASSLKSQPSTLNASAPVILTVSRLSSTDHYKGIDHLIAALPAIRQANPATTLRIVGRGDDLPRLQNLAQANAVADAVEFTGFVSDAQLRDEFARCTLFALPSQKEGFGLVYLEAMTAGKPCLAAAAAGAPEVITPESGLIVPYGDVPALAAATITMLGKTWDPAAIRACAEQFSYPRFKQRLAAALSP